MLALNKLKIKPTTKLPWENLSIHFWGHYLVLQALHPGFSDAWRSPPTLSSILTQGYFFFECLGIQFFNSLTCELRDAMPRQRSLTLLPEEAEDFPRSSSHSNHMSPLTYLVWLQTICYNSRLVFIEINTAKAFTCCENFDKKYRAAAKLISNHKLQNNCSLKKCISKLMSLKYT